MPRKPSIPARLVPRSPPESRHDRSRRVANQRFRILKADMIRMGRLGGTGYELHSGEVDKLCELLGNEFTFMCEQLRRAKGATYSSDDIFADE